MRKNIFLMLIALLLIFQVNNSVIAKNQIYNGSVIAVNSETKMEAESNEMSTQTGNLTHTTLGEIIFYALDVLIAIKLISYVVYISKKQEKKYLEDKEKNKKDESL